MMQTDIIWNEAKALDEWLVETRRDIHKHPELGMDEYRTREKVTTLLDEMGIPYETGYANTGVVGYIEGAKRGKTVALRADMDALPIQETNDVPYRSTVDGKMHACGHDAHTTILLGTAQLLQKNKEQLHGTVKLFFQPAEETVGGAKPMIEEGVMDHPKVDAVFGLHVAPEIPVGQVGVKYGQMNASSDTLHMSVKGNSGHGAYPHEGKDAIVIASHVVTALQSIVSRNVDPRESAVISIGEIHGGKQKNIIADEVNMVGTLRTFTDEVRQLSLERIDEVLRYTTKALGGSYQFELGTDGYTSLINNDAMVDLVKQAAVHMLGVEKVRTINQASMGVEDFAYFSKAAPSAFFRLGCRNEEKGIIHGAHTGAFDIDEDCLAIGVAMQTKNVIDFLSPDDV
ncbi:MAG TPA: M20 family metallopeptidase [Virgibacillus sp.]|nr:M20 family metallopeptidase [Virgibacillus sp.]